LAGLALGLSLGLWRRRVRLARQRAELRVAHDRLAAALARGPADALKALEELCGACAGGLPFQGDATWTALERSTAPPQLLARLRTVHAELEAARYGGPSPAPHAVLDAAGELAALSATRAR
jgi:hypothetical protein